MLVPLAFLQASLTLGPASLSLPDLAAALTRAGMATECGPALRERAALVSLHGRSPEAVRRVLGESLGVAFVPNGEGWRMVVDDAARTRDAQFQARYEAYAVRNAAAWAESQRQARGGLDYMATVARADEAASALRERSRGGDDLSVRVAALVRQSQPNAWIAAALLRDAAFVRQAVAEGSATQSLPAASVEAATGVPLAAYLPDAKRLGVDPTRGGTLVLSARFDALQGTLLVHSFLQVDGKQVGGVRTFQNAVGHEVGGTSDGYEVVVDLESGPVETTFDALGPQAAAYLRGLAPTPALPERPRLSPAPWTLSSSLEGLCGATGQDLVMELSPRFEPVPQGLPGGTPPPTQTFRSALAPEPGRVGGLPEVGAYVAQEFRSGATVATRARRAARRHPWRTVDRDGVWLVVDPYGFLDRAHPISPVPFLAAERALREQGSGRIPAAPTVATAQRIARAMPHERMSALSSVLDYRDLGLRDGLALMRMVQAVDGSPSTARNAFWRDLRDAHVGTVDTPQGRITLRLNGVESDPGVVGGYLFPGGATGGGDLGYVRFDGRGTVLP